MSSSPVLFPHFYNPHTLYSTYSSHLNSQSNSYLSSTSSTQQQIVLSCLKMILNYPNSIFQFSPSQGFSLTEIIHLSHLTPRVITNISINFIQYANKIQFMKTKIKEFRKYQSAVLQELIDGVEEYDKRIIREFTELYVVADFQAGNASRKHVMVEVQRMGYDLREPLTLMRLSNIVKGKFQSINIVVGLLNKIHKNTRGEGKNMTVVVLDTVWELLDKFESFDVDNQISQLFLKLSIQPLKRYLEMVHRWFSDTMKNQVTQSKHQFYIKKNKQGEYFISKQQIPLFLKNVFEKIFSFGKFIKIIYCFANEEDIMNINEFMNSKQQFQSLFSQMDVFVKNKQEVVSVKQQKKRFHTISSLLKEQKSKIAKIEYEKEVLPYDLHVYVDEVFEINHFPEPKHAVVVGEQREMEPLVIVERDSVFLSDFKLKFETYVNFLLDTISGKCSEYFNFRDVIPPFQTIPEHIYNNLFCIRSFILFEQGDFIQQLIQNIGEQLQKPSSIIQQNLISDSIEITLLNSNAKFVSPKLLKKIHFKFISKEPELSGWDRFYLEYRMQPPFHYLFPEQTMERYNKLFNFIWKLKYIQYLMKQISYNNKGNKQTKTYYLFRNSLHLFSSTMMSDILLQVKDEWDRFMLALKKLESLEEFLDLHRGMIGRLEGVMFFNQKERTVHGKLDYVIQIIVKLKELMGASDEEIDERDRQREIEKLSAEFKMRVKDLIYVNSSFSVDIVDFTGFYEF